MLSTYPINFQKMADGIEEMDYDQPLPSRMSLFEEYGHRVTGRMKKGLFSTQLEALDSLTKWFSKDATKNKTAVVQMPTGSGKTGIIACLPYKFGYAVRKGEISLNLKRPIPIIAPGRVILDQLEKNLKPSDNNSCFLTERSIIKSSEVNDALYTTKVVQTSRELSSLNYSRDHIIIVNAQKFNPTPQDPPTTWRDLPRDVFSIVIVDEAHHLPSKQWEQIVCYFRQPTTKVIFFTATPIRADRQEITTDSALRDLGFAYTLSREDAIRKGFIRDVEFNPIPHDPHETNTRYDHTNMEQRIRYAMLVVGRVVSLLDQKNREHPLPGGKNHAALVVTRDKAEATFVVMLAKRDYPNLPITEVHGGVREEERKQRIAQLKEGKIRIIVMVGMLLEGFDHPPISVAAIVTRIHSRVKFAQFIGRAQRVVRVEQEVEQDVVAHIVTHEYFQQKKNYDEYITPIIPVDENDERFTKIDSDND